MKKKRRAKAFLFFFTEKEELKVIGKKPRDHFVEMVLHTTAQNMFAEVKYEQSPLWNQLSDSDKDKICGSSQKSIVQHGQTVNFYTDKATFSNSGNFSLIPKGKGSDGGEQFSLEADPGRVNLILPGGIVGNNTEWGYNIMDVNNDEDYLKMDGLMVLNSQGDIEWLHNHIYPHSEGMLFANEKGTLFSEENVPNFHGRLIQYIMSSRQVKRRILVQDDFIDEDVLPIGLAKKMSNWGMKYSSVCLRLLRENKEKLSTHDKAFEKEIAAVFPSLVGKTNKELVDSITSAVQEVINNHKEEMIRFIGVNLSLSEKLSPTTKALKAAIEAHKSSPEQAELRPRIFADFFFEGKTALASWTSSPRSVNDDGSLKLSFPFKMYSPAVCRLAGKFVAAKMIYSDLPIPLWYTGCVPMEE